MPGYLSTENQIKEACQLTDVSWAGLVEREAGRWRVLTHYHLARPARPALVKFLNTAEVDFMAVWRVEWRTKSFRVVAGIQ